MDLNEVQRLVENLARLGFEGVGRELLWKATLRLPQFFISVKQSRARDTLRFELFFQRKDDFYHCPYYDALLRRNTQIPDLDVNGISLDNLNRSMEVIDWKEFFEADKLEDLQDHD